MPFVKTFLIKPFSTNITLNPPISCVNRHVVVSILSFSESFCTELAPIPYTCMFIHVKVINCFTVVTLSTQFTIERKFRCVILHVLVKSSLRVVLFIGSRANEQLCLQHLFYIRICHLCRKSKLVSFPVLQKLAA